MACFMTNGAEPHLLVVSGDGCLNSFFLGHNLSPAERRKPRRRQRHHNASRTAVDPPSSGTEGKRGITPRAPAAPNLDACPDLVNILPAIRVPRHPKPKARSHRSRRPAPVFSRDPLRQHLATIAAIGGLVANVEAVANGRIRLEIHEFVALSPLQQVIGRQLGYLLLPH